MTQFHAHVNLDAETRRQAPYVLDLQSGLLDDLATRLVAPLVPHTRQMPTALQRLNPVLEVDGDAHLMLTQNLFAMPRQLIGPSMADCHPQQHAIVAALDCLLSGV